MNLFMMPPVMAMHGMMEVRARAKRQLRLYARMKPVKKDDAKETLRATFSEIPCCTRSGPYSELIQARIADIDTYECPFEYAL